MVNTPNVLFDVTALRVLMFSQMMYGGAWRRNCSVLGTMKKVSKNIDYVLLIESSNINLVPNAERVISGLKEVHDVRFLKMPSFLNRFTPSHYAYLAKLSREFRDLAKRESADLIYVPHEVDWWILAAKNASKGTLPWTALFQSTPMFVCVLKPSSEGPLSTMMQTPALAYKSLRALRGLYRYSRLRLLVTALRETLSLSVSKSATLAMRAFYPWLKIRTLMPGNGVDLGYISSIQPSPDRFDAIYFTSELLPQKGFLDLPIIWKSVVQRISDAKLLIVGKTHEPYLSQFRELLQKFGLEESVVLYDLLPHDKLISLVKSSKVMVYPSKFDTFPLVILESLASGVPVVAYNIPPVRLNYATGNVIKCPVDDIECMAANVSAILSDENLGRNLSKEAIKYAARFSWENVAREEAEAYSKVLDFWSSK